VNNIRAYVSLRNERNVTVCCNLLSYITTKYY